MLHCAAAFVMVRLKVHWSMSEKWHASAWYCWMSQGLAAPSLAVLANSVVLLPPWQLLEGFQTITLHVCDPQIPHPRQVLANLSTDDWSSPVAVFMQTFAWLAG